MNPNEPEPEILQAEWDREQVLQLFADLAAGAEVQHVQLRTKDADSPATLQAAEEAFIRGNAEAVQVRYLFEQEAWCDTIMPGNPTTKIIRNRLPAS